jgi:hypothetical protein
LLSLINRGITTSCSIDKNIILEEVAGIWERESAILDANLARNAARLDELNYLQGRLQFTTDECEELQRRTLFAREAPTTRPMKSITTIVRAITETETAIAGHGWIDNPERLAQIQGTSDSPETKRFQLTDLLFRRLEDYIYALRKRGVIVEEGYHTAKAMEKDYPTIAHLVSQYKERLRRNGKLRDEESLQIDDAAAKRRHLQRCPDEIAQSLTCLLQQYLNTNYTVLDWLTPGGRKRWFCHAAPFDVIARDRGFELSPLQFSKGEFDVVSRDEVIRALVSGDDVDEKLKALTTLAEDLSSAESLLMEELKNVRQMRRCLLDPSLIFQEMSRLWYLNDELFDVIVGQHEDIDLAIQEARDIIGKISKVIDEHRTSNRTWALFREEMDALRKTHAELQALQSANGTITSTLLQVVQTLARNEAKSRSVSEYCQAQLRVTVPVRANPKASLPKLDGERGSTMNILFDRVMHAPRSLLAPSRLLLGRQKTKSIVPRRARDARSRGSVSDSSVSGMLFEAMASAKFRAHESLILVARALAVGGSRPGLYETFRKCFTLAISDVRAHTHRQFGAFANELTRELERIKQISDPILVIPKADVEVQTEPLPLEDAETNTPFEEIKRKKSRPFS